MLLYIFKSAILLAILYSCYYVLLSKETFHKFNRIMLLIIMITSIILPTIKLTTENSSFVNEKNYKKQLYIEQYSNVPISFNQDNKKTIENNERISFSLQAVLVLIYFTGVILMSVFVILQTILILKISRAGLRHTDAFGNTVILTSKNISPFSFFHFIVMNVKDYEDNRSFILAHEQEHIRLRHTYDLLLSELIKIMQWFNPFIWFLKRDLISIHEFEVDEEVIKKGIDAKLYQKLLVIKTVGSRMQVFANNLNHGALKTRIIMMYKKKTNKWMTLKSLFVIPVATLFLNAYATPEEPILLNRKIMQPVDTLHFSTPIIKYESYQRNVPLEQTILLPGNGVITIVNKKAKEGDWIHVSLTDWNVTKWGYSVRDEFKYSKTRPGFKAYIYASTMTSQTDIERATSLFRELGITNYEVVKDIPIKMYSDAELKQWAIKEKKVHPKYDWKVLFDDLAKENVCGSGLNKQWHLVKAVYEVK